MLAFIGGSDNRKSIVIISCAQIYDRVKKLREPIELIYVIEIATKLACSPITHAETSKEEITSVSQIIESSFNKMKHHTLKPCIYFKPG